MNDLKMDLNIISGITEIDDNDAETIAGGRFKVFFGTGKANALTIGDNPGVFELKYANRLLINNTGSDGVNNRNNRFQLLFTDDSGPIGQEFVRSGNASRKFNQLKKQGALFVTIRQGKDIID